MDLESHLIEEVREHPVLYNYSAPNHEKDLLWLEIASKLNLPVKSVKRKWRSIKDYYYHLKRNERVNKCGDYPCPKKKWKHYDNLWFLNEPFKLKSQHSSTNNNSWDSPSSSSISFLSADSDIDYMLSEMKRKTSHDDPLAISETDENDTGPWNIKLINIEGDATVEKKNDKLTATNLAKLGKQIANNDVSCKMDMDETDDDFSETDLPPKMIPETKRQINNNCSFEQVDEVEKEKANMKDTEVKNKLESESEIPITLHQDVLTFVTGTFNILQPDDRKIFEKRIVDLTMKYRILVT